MNVPIARSGAVAALCGALLAACNAVEDVRLEPTVPVPGPTGVLQGTILGLGARRPVVLQNNDDVAGARAFLNSFGQSSTVFSFDSVPIGAPYRITVRTQPLAKICTVANGAGIVGSPDARPITVTCVDDPAIPRYCVGGTISGAVHDEPGAKIILTTEEGTRVQPAVGLPVDAPATCWFDDAVFDSQSSLPVFEYAVTATFTAADGTVNNCAVTNGRNAAIGSGADSRLQPPTADVMNVQVLECSFTVSAEVSMDTGVAAQPLGSGMVLALREPRSGMNVQIASVPEFATVVFPGVLSNQEAIYELVVEQQPAGQTCLVGGVGQLAWASAVLLLDPADPVHRWMIARQVRCRPIPAPASQLTGTYQLATIVSSGTTTTRNFLTFFADGTFLYGVHAPGVTSGPTGGVASAASGVEHGFYAYDPAAGTIVFTVLTDTITGFNPARLSFGGAPRILTAVARTAGTPARITARFNSTVQWLLTEPRSVEGQMTGAWSTDDHRRVWVYDGSTYAGFHAGVNGLGNAQDACFPVDPPESQSGYFTRRGNSTTCELLDGPPTTTLMYTLEIPNLTTTPRVPEGFIGLWPQSGSNSDGRPSSPVLFTIEPGIPDTLIVQDTATDGTPRHPPIVLRRNRAN